MGIRRATALVAVASWCAAASAVASPVTTPLDVELAAGHATLEWVLHAHTDVVVRSARWRSIPADLVTTPPTLAGLVLGAGETARGRVAVALAPGQWVELQIEAATPFGAVATGGSARARMSQPGERVAVVADKVARGTPGTVRGQFLYEARALDAGGYSGRVRRLPIRHVEAELVSETTGAALARTRTDADGRFELDAHGIAGTASVRLRSWTRGHPQLALRVVAPPRNAEDPLREARPHEIRTAPFAVGAAGVDLGTLVGRDPDGYGVVQAFHILDVAIDAFEAVGSPSFPGPAPTPRDSLGIFWGPELRIRSSAQGRDLIEITSPGSGDTDGWSDTIILHEVGHFVAQRFLRESNPGGIHLLGDVEQDLRLAWAEGLATAFACWVRDWRAASRRDADGARMDDDVARYVNVGLPPPDGVAGGLQFAWDIESHRLGARALAREGIGSETNVAGLLWDLADGPASADAAAGDDDTATLAVSRAWQALRAMRAIPEGRAITFEDFWLTFQGVDPQPAALDPLLLEARVEFTPDAAEPDGLRAPALWAARPYSTPGGVVLSEIALGVLIAVEITNRDKVPHDLSGWALVALGNGSSGAPSLTFTLPEGTRIGAGGRLVVHRGGGGPASARDVIAGLWTTPWFPGFEGAVALRDAGGLTVDFVRWNGRDGVQSMVPPPASVGWQGDLLAADFGQVLSRIETLPDRDRADDFTAADPSLGAPNDTPTVHRTFFPAGDTDVQSWEVPYAGVYTIEVRRPRNGAMSRLEAWLQGADEPLAVVTANNASRVPARITVRLDAGPILELRTTHVGTRTRFGTYDVALYAEPDPVLPLAPIALQTSVQLLPGGGRVRLEWWNAAVYDAVRVRVGSGEWTTLPGDVRAWDVELPRGPQRLAVASEVAGITTSAPELVVDVDDWAAELVSEFDAGGEVNWEWSGFATAAAPGRAGTALVAPADAGGAARLLRGVRIQPGSVLEFDQICAAPTERAARLELTTDWGATWETLGQWDWNAHTGDDASGPDWRDGHADPQDWVHERIALDAWAGHTVQLRLRVQPERGQWVVDALRVHVAAPPPFAVVLHPAVPNPFNPTTRLGFELSQPAPVQLDILDVRGRHLRTLLASVPYPAGTWSVMWDGRDDGGRGLASGVYFARLRARDQSQSRKLVLVR